MWETVDNIKRLKTDAVPSEFPTSPKRKRLSGEIFCRSGKKQRLATKIISDNSSENPTIKPIMIVSDERSENPTNESTMIISNLASTSTNPENLTTPAIEVEYEVGNQIKMSQQKSEENTDPTLMKEQNKLPKCDEESVQKLFAKQEHQIKFLKSRLNKVVKEKRRLVSEKHSTYKAILLTLFTEDQINHLIKQQRAGEKSKVTKWSNTTVKKALRLKFACGTAGYEELLKQGFPFPSRRTLT
ncbi:uncharacterized protein LOC122512006 [Leptopilina heterotoma]|uniref:uncharacterized protein LOC122512006 n=1 Tax=Leptopilina heterotoma TaxID=63436 RepID=UPI001CA9E40C|nr:uncharacterized protein LOC122512006 [Leptopilina heterotoma]